MAPLESRTGSGRCYSGRSVLTNLTKVSLPRVCASRASVGSRAIDDADLWDVDDVNRRPRLAAAARAR